MTSKIGIALLGTGTVGGGVHDLLGQNAALLRERTGFEFEIVVALARDARRAAQRLSNQAPIAANWQEALAHPRCDMVVELIGGETDARDIALACLGAHKPLITANKALLATSGAQLIKAAREHGSGVYFEAAVAGAIPAIRMLRDSLVGESISSIVGITNGTCNYILSKMASENVNFAEALAQASSCGYAEADPALDIDGWDAAHKAVIMSWLAFGTPLQMGGIQVRGVRDFARDDLLHAARFGYAVKLIATVRAHAGGSEISVMPALVPDDHTLAKVSDNLNAILFTSDASGELTLIGAGAGAAPTASAVVSDIVQAAREMVNGHPTLPPPPNGAKVLDFAEVCCESYLRISVIDSQGIVAQVSSLLNEAGISIEALHQDESISGQPTDVVLLLHEAPWGHMLSYAQKIGALGDVIAPPALMPIAIPHAKQ